MPIQQHPPHHLDSRAELLAHLSDAHGYGRDELLGSPTAFVVLHDRGHRSGPLPDDAGLTTFAFAGRADHAGEHLFLDLDALALVDPSAAERLAARYADRLGSRYTP